MFAGMTPLIHRFKKASWWFFAVLFVILLFFAFFIPNQIEKHMLYIRNDLQSVSEINSNHIRKWWDEKRGDAQLIFQLEPIQELLRGYLQNPSDESKREKIIAWMKSIHETNEYKCIVLYDNRGEVALCFPEEHIKQSNSHNTDDIRKRLMLSKDIVPIDFHTHIPDKKNETESVSLGLWIPVMHQTKEQVHGGVILENNPESYIFPLLQSWPTFKKTTETLLLTRNGDGLTCVNRTRHGRLPPLTLKFPLVPNPQPDTPSFLASSNPLGFSEGLDYRGERVLAFTQEIKNTSWVLETKIDYSDIYRPILKRLAYEMGLLLLVLALIIQAVRTRGVEKQKKLIDSINESEERFRNVFEHAAHSIIWFDVGTGRIININSAAADMLGRPVEQNIGLGLKEIHPQDSWDECIESFRVCVEKGSEEIETEIVTAGGERRKVLINGSVIKLKSSVIAQGIFTDITEKKHAERECAKNSLRLQLAMQASELGVWEWDLKTDTWTVDAAMIQMLGIEEPAQMNLEKFIADFVVDEDRKQVLEAFKESASCCTKLDVSYRMLGKSGDIHHLESHGLMLAGGNGSRQKMIGVTRDITEQVKMMRTLAESEELWKFALEGSGNGVWDYYVTTGRIVYSKQWKAMLGYEESDIGFGHEEWEKLIHPDDRKNVFSNIDSFFYKKQRFYTSEHRLRCKNGDYKWVLSKGLTVKYDNSGTPIRIVGTNTDITDQKKAEAALQSEIVAQRGMLKAQMRVDYILDAMDDGLWETDFQNNIYNYSPKMFTMLGYPPLQGQAGMVFFSSKLHPDDIDRIMAYIQNLKEGKIETWSETFRIQDANGSWRHILTRAKCINSGDGNPSLKYVGTHTDVTERKQLEFHMQNERHIIREEVTKQTAELVKRNEELDSFAHTVAHNLKTSTTALALQAESLLNMDGIDQNVQRIAYNIASSARASNRIVDEILLFSRIRKTDLVKRPVDIELKVERAIMRLAHMVEEFRVEFEYPDSWPAIESYGPWIEEIWFNYLSNAIQYGGRPPVIVLGWTQHGESQIKFWVKDNGRGIEQENIHRLFIPFSQLGSTEWIGHGLGLSIVKSMVDKLDGQVLAESVFGQGSTFSFILPM